MLENGRKRLTTRIWLLISIALIIISVFGAYFTQTAGGTVTVRHFKLITGGGLELNAEIYLPNDASSTKKLPLVVCQHGSQHNLEMQDMDMVELARRGFIVISGDAYGQGSSSPTSTTKELGAKDCGSVVELVEYACNNLTCVDTDKIALVGHSMGARMVTSAMEFYLKQEVTGQGPMRIKAVCEQGFDPDYAPISFKGVDGKYIADCSWGVIAGKYDEFFFKQKDVGNDPARILESKAALGWIQQADKNATGPVESGKYYSGTINGKDCIRAYWSIPANHPLEIFSSKSAAAVVDFIYTTIGVPAGHAKIAPDNQVWMFKQIFNGIGLAALLLFMYPFACLLIEGIPFFGSLKKKELPAAPALVTKTSKAIYWGGWAIAAAIPGLLAMPIMNDLVGKNSLAPTVGNAWFGQGGTVEVAIWACVSSVCIFAVFFVGWMLYGKKHGSTIDSWGVKTSAKDFGKSVLLSIMVFGAICMILFIADFFFVVDFRFWLIAFRVFTANKIWYLLAFAPAFIFFYCINTILVNGVNRVEGMAEWKVTLISCIGNVASIAILLVLQFVIYFCTDPHTFPFNAMRTHNMYPFIILVPIATIITRKFYKKTGSIYAGSFIIAFFYTMLQITNTANLYSIVR